jgi:hypothetical protein
MNIRNYKLVFLIILLTFANISCHKVTAPEAKTIANEEFVRHCQSWGYDQSLFSPGEYQEYEQNEQFIFRGVWGLKTDPETLVMITIEPDGHPVFAGQNTDKIPRKIRK